MANINNIEDVKNLESWDVGVTIHRTNPFPLDNSSYFTNIEDAQDYATNGATSHVGQELFVITEVDGGTVVDTYVIQNSDGLLEKLATKSITDRLSANIAAIFDDVRGGVNYKGHIDLDETAIDSLPKYPADMALSSIFATYFKIINPAGEYVENKSLNNGWLYNITTRKEYVTKEGISLENNDYIIIHDHGLSSVDVSALTRDNIDLIEAVQDDYIRLYQFSSLSVRLSTEIEDLSTGLSVDAREKASALSGEIESLSAALSGDVDALSDHLSTDINSLSDALSGEIRALSTALSNEITALSEELSSTVNINYVHISGDEGVGPLGLSSTLSVASNLTLGNKDSSYKFNIDSNTGKLKYTVGNNDLTSTTYDIDLQSKDGTIALTSDVQDLSTTIDEQFILSSEAVDLIQGTLLDRISVLSNDISSNTKEILSNDADINYLSALLSTVANDHYYKTLSAIYNDNCPDNLLITDHTDEPIHKNYVLVFKYGTLVLSSIS